MFEGGKQAGSSDENQSSMTWYICGQTLPTSGKLGASFERTTLERVKQSMPNLNLVPTTYDASRAYLEE